MSQGCTPSRHPWASLFSLPCRLAPLPWPHLSRPALPSRNAAEGSCRSSCGLETNPRRHSGTLMLRSVSANWPSPASIADSTPLSRLTRPHTNDLSKSSAQTPLNSIPGIPVSFIAPTASISVRPPTGEAAIWVIAPFASPPAATPTFGETFQLPALRQFSTSISYT